MIGAVCVSVDAAEAEVYEDLRRPGKWSVITQNLEFLSQLRRADRVPYVSLNFVVQQKNYRQIPAFIEMTRALGFDRALFLKLINIGSFTADEFVENDVCDPRHPEHQEFLATLRHPAVRWPEVHLFTLQPYLELSGMTA
jgi:MoaA/NifB/PqqE/SkfB family radical SAM enzyme